LLYTTISIDFNSPTSFPVCQAEAVGNFGVRLKILERSGVGNGNFGKVGVGYLPPTLQPWFTLMVKPVHACHLFYISFQFNLQFGTYSVDNAI